MKRITIIALVLLLAFSMSISVFADEATLDNDNTQTTIDIYAKYESGTEGIYSAEIANGGATVNAGDVTVTVSGATDTAKTVEIYPIPTTETEALEWMGGKVSDHGTLSHAYIISLVDANGNKTSANGVSVTISCSHCSGDEIVMGLNTDGTATPIETANGSFTANGNAYYVVAEKKASSGTDNPPVTDPNNPDNPDDPDNPGDLVPEPQIDNGGFPWWTIPVGVVVLGGGGFAIYWFVIKKKTWADLIAVFKRNK